MRLIFDASFRFLWCSNRILDDPSPIWFLIRFSYDLVVNFLFLLLSPLLQFSSILDQPSSRFSCVPRSIQVLLLLLYSIFCFNLGFFSSFFFIVVFIQIILLLCSVFCFNLGVFSSFLLFWSSSDFIFLEYQSSAIWFFCFQTYLRTQFNFLRIIIWVT